jgi:NAD(P)-dependent dehydrogenase (short-subunit alcohol dehydrogenase family)
VTTPLAGKVALVSGAASGIGRATAELLGARGASVVVADLPAQAEAAAAVVAAIGAAGGSARFVPTDVTDPTQVQAMVDAAIDTFGGLHLAVNNAGTPGTFAPLDRQTLDDWNAVVAVNLTAVFLAVQAEVPALLAAGGGSIVNVASAAGLMGFAHLPAYVATKHAVIGLTKSVALEYARAGVRVNAVCPGSVRTPMLEGFAGGDETVLDGMGRGAPMGRLGTPSEIAEAIAWLCSDASGYVTGHSLAVDGGVLAT